MGTGGSVIVIDFSDRGNSAYFRLDGWSGQEREMVWSVGPCSGLRVPVQTAGRPLVLEAEILPCRHPPMFSGQLVQVRVNGTGVGSARLERRSMIRCVIDPSIARPTGVADIEFLFPGFARPDMIYHTKETRPLGGRFSFVRVYTMDLFQPGPTFPPSDPDFPVIDLVPSPATVSPAEFDRAAEIAIYTFGATGTATPYLGAGWSREGQVDFTWTVALASQIELPAPRVKGAYVLRLDARPLSIQGAVSKQNVTILLDRIVIGQICLDEAQSWILPLPRALIEGRPGLALTFIMPNARRPSEVSDSPDNRLLGVAFSSIAVIPVPSRLSFDHGIRTEHEGGVSGATRSGRFLSDTIDSLPAAIEAALGVTPAELLRKFESIGDNCEFGMVQKKLGLEILNLFRFCNAPLQDLLRALADDLQAMTDPGSLTLELNDAVPREYSLNLPAYNMHWHTFTHEGEVDPEVALRKHAIKLGYLRRKFYEGLRVGQKIYVIKRERSIPAARAAAILLELNRHGPATLLCVEPASGSRSPGEVELLMPGLMRGYVKKFAIPVDSVEPADWLRVIANATLLHRETQAPVIDLARAA